MKGTFELQLNDHTLFDHSFSDDHFIRAVVKFVLPEVHVFKHQQDSWSEWYREIGIRCPTVFLFHRSDYFWSLSVVLLGFGAGISYQNGY